MIPGLLLWAEIHYDFGDDFSQQFSDKITGMALAFFETPWPSSCHWGPHLILGPSGPLLALSGPSHLSYLWAPLICLLRPSDDMGLKLGIEKVKDGAMPQSAVGNNNCYKWGRDRISRGSREPQGFLKLKKVSEAVRWATVIQEGLRGSCESLGVSWEGLEGNWDGFNGGWEGLRGSCEGLGVSGGPQRQLGGPWEGRGAETIMKMKATT